MSAFIWVDNRFGLIVTGVGAAAFAILALSLSERWARWALSFVAAQACINAVLDIRVLFRAQLVINGQPVGQSDAHRMASAAGGSPVLWAVLWLIWSFGAFYLALRFTHTREQPQAPRAHQTDLASSGSDD